MGSSRRRDDHAPADPPAGIAARAPCSCPQGRRWRRSSDRAAPAGTAGSCSEQRHRLARRHAQRSWAPSVAPVVQLALADGAAIPDHGGGVGPLPRGGAGARAGAVRRSCRSMNEAKTNIASRGTWPPVNDRAGDSSASLMTIAPDARHYILTVLPGPAASCTLSGLDGARRQHRGGRAVQRPRHRPVLHAGAVRLHRAGRRRAARPAADAGRALCHALAAARGGAAHAHRDLRQPRGPLPERSAVPLEERPAAAGHPRHRQQPPRLLPAGGQLQRAVSPHPRHARSQGAGRGTATGDHRVRRRRAGGAGALHADPVGRHVPAAFRARHQHPPQLPAELQGRAAILAGARARRR